MSPKGRPPSADAEISAEKRKVENAALDLTAEERAAKASAHYLAEFTSAARMYLPKITTDADRERARQLVADLTSAARAHTEQTTENVAN
jgi:hypothetical protein